MFPRVNLEERQLEGPALDFLGLFERLLGGVTGLDTDALMSTLHTWWSTYSIIAMGFSLLFFAGFIYAKIHYDELSEIEQEELRQAEEAWKARVGERATENSRWATIENHVREENPNAWRLAIIEADILLEETLENAGYVGATIGDKLKMANPAAFTTLQDAWEAHKVRNEIAHTGSDFVLTKRLTQETIMRYERVFREFKVI